MVGPRSSPQASSSDTAEKAHFGANDIGWQALGPAIACVILATAVVTARWIARRRLAQCEGLDDYVILLSLTLSWAMTALIAVEVNGGMGVYEGSVDVQTIAKLVVASNCLWILIVNITKASILIQYLRIFSSRAICYLCYAFLFLLIPATLWAIFGGVFLCSPIAKLWNPELEGHCISAQSYWLSVAGNDIGLDFLILILPLPAIAGLHLPPKQKAGLTLVFTLGFFVCIVSIVRLLTVLMSSNQGHYTESAIWAIVWSAVEANVGIICASLLSLKPLITKPFPRVIEESSPAPHSMRIALIDDIWRDERMKIYPRSASSPTTPTASHSKNSSLSQPFNTAHLFSKQPLAELNSVRMLGPERPTSAFVPGRLGLLDILQENGEEVRSQVARRGSWFREHV